MDDHLWTACVALWHLTGAARVCVGCSGCDAVLLKELGDSRFNFGALRNGYATGKVFDGVEKTLVFDDSDADCVQIGIEEIGAVGRGGHPDLLEGCWIIGVTADVLGDGTEVGSGLCAAGHEIRLSGILMELIGLVDDPFGVRPCGVCKSAVPMQGREIMRGSGLVG